MHEQLVDDLSLDGKVAVVTGAGSGIGRGIADVFAQAGAKLTLGDLSTAGMAETIALAEKAGSPAIGVETDVASRDAVDRLAQAALAQWGRIDIWVNCAGIIVRQPLADVTETEVRRQIDVNLLGPVWGCAAAFRAMKARGTGSIINISSAGGDGPVPEGAIYCMTKAAVNMCTFNSALEFGPAGIRVNAIAPGFTDTPMTSAALETDPAKRDAIYKSRAQGSPLGLIGQPRDIALAALYLASAASRYVTGQVIRVNGGASMR